MVMLLYRTLQCTLGYETIIRLKWVMAAGNNFAFKIAAKPLQIEIWLRLTAIRTCPNQRYQRWLPTYRLATIHALQTARQTTHRTQTQPIGRLKIWKTQNLEFPSPSKKPFIESFTAVNEWKRRVNAVNATHDLIAQNLRRQIFSFGYCYIIFAS